MRFDGRSLLACAWGRPSAAFGPAYRAFDGVRRLARLPGPPYQFMSRVTRLEGEMGAMREGSAVEVEYDIPADAWYFAANGARTMPFAVLLEAALQPCGWLATWAGSPLTTERDLSFRNLDGDGRLLAEVFPGDGRLRTRAVLTRISRSAGMLIESFDVTCSVGERPVYELKTVFGYFPAEALARQVGLPAAAGEREALDEATRGVDRPAHLAGARGRGAAAPGSRAAADARPRDRHLARRRSGRARTLSRRDRRRPRGLVLQGALLPGPGAARFARSGGDAPVAAVRDGPPGMAGGPAARCGSSRWPSASRTPGSTGGRCCRATGA